MNESPLTTTTATGDQVADVADRMVGAVLDVEDPMLVVMAAISIAFLVQDAELEAEQLAKGVYGASKWIAEFISTANQASALPTAQMN